MASSLPVPEVSPPLQKEARLLARQSEIGMPLVSSLAAGEITSEGSTSRDTGHGGGFAAWGKATPTETKKKAGQGKMRWLEEEWLVVVLVEHPEWLGSGPALALEKL